MKRRILFLLMAGLVITANLDAASKKTNFTATASVAGSLQFTVALSNAGIPGTFVFGSVAANNVPALATNQGRPTFAFVTYNVSHPNWEIKVYTDNTNALASPRYKGPGNMLYGNINDGTGLVGAGAGANASNSTPLKVWCDSRFPDGSFAKAPCSKWKGTAAGFFGVPRPAGETGLYWANQNLNGDGDDTDAIATNAHWLESSAGYDANGDGDTLDSSTGTSGDALGQVFEYPFWMSVAADKARVPGANTAVLMDSLIGSGVITSGHVKAYFAVTDDVAGNFSTSQLVFELVTQ